MSKTTEKWTPEIVGEMNRQRRALSKRKVVEELIDVLAGVAAEEARAEERLAVARRRAEVSAGERENARRQVRTLDGILKMASKQKAMARRVLLAAVEDLASGIRPALLDDIKDDIEACERGREFEACARSGGHHLDARKKGDAT
jgi:pantothenate synthetase